MAAVAGGARRQPTASGRQPWRWEEGYERLIKRASPMHDHFFDHAVNTLGAIHRLRHAQIGSEAAQRVGVLARQIALRNMINLICERTGISREDAYTLCSLAADLRVTQVVNGAKGIHVMLEKKLLQKGRS